MKWILDEEIESMKYRIEILHACVKYHESKMEQYKDVFNTDDKFEAKTHEYHRTYRIALLEQIKWIREELEEINNMMIEDIKRDEEAEEDLREKRADAYI